MHLLTALTTGPGAQPYSFGSHASRSDLDARTFPFLVKCLTALLEVAPPAGQMLSTLILVENNSVPADSRVWAECMSLRRAGWSVTVICPKGRSRDTEQFADVNGVSIHRFSLDQSRGRGGYIREYLVAFHKIRSLVRDLHE